MNPKTDPNGVPDPSATFKGPESSSTSQDPADAVMKDADEPDISYDAADDDAADAAAKAAATRSGVGGADQSGVDGVGYWQVAWLYLTSLLKLGEAYETAGSHEDAAHAFKEGLELVCHFWNLIHFCNSNMPHVQLYYQARVMCAVYHLYMTMSFHMAADHNMVDQNLLSGSQQLSKACC